MHGRSGLPSPEAALKAWRRSRELPPFDAFGSADASELSALLEPTSDPAIASSHFGYLFPPAEEADLPTDAQLATIGAAMVDAAEGEATSLPARLTYLGQFVDHCVTLDVRDFDLGSLADGEVVPNLRTPRLDLDAVYGQGPVASAHLYEGDRFVLGSTRPVNDQRFGLPAENDLPRVQGKRAALGDPRNDENLIVAQLHLLFLLAHNAQVAAHGSFDRARRECVWGFQRVVEGEFLAALLDPEQWEDLRANGRKLVLPGPEHRRAELFVPFEFAVAAYRFGHSMVRPTYDYNAFFGPNGVKGPATIQLLFRFTGSGGLVPVPADWVIDWPRFLTNEQSAPQPAMKLNCGLDSALHALPAGFDLAVRNLQRGRAYRLTSGQAAIGGCRDRGIEIRELTPDELASGIAGAELRAAGLHERNTPLWFYILKEAEVLRGGEGLGPLGSRLVGEVFHAMLDLDEASIWNDGAGEPVPFSTMAELVALAGRSAGPKP